LAGWQFRNRALQAQRDSAGLKPELRLSAEAENIAGSGDYRGAQSAELTLALSSVIELGDKRDARVGVVSERQAAALIEQRIAQLDLLAEVTRCFIEAASAQELLGLQQATRTLAEETARVIKHKVAAGNTPEAEFARAEAQQARAAIAQRQAQLRFENAKTHLAGLWASTTPAFNQVQADLFSLGQIAPLVQLQAGLADNPDLRRLASQVRLQDAQLRLAQAQRRADLQWSVGIRRLQASEDSAITLGVSMPLGAPGRARSEIEQARAERAGLDNDQDVAQLRLRNQLSALYHEREGAVFAATSLRNKVIPPLTKALHSARAAFEKGRYSYLELSSAQQELLDAQAALIDAATSAHLLRVEIERLTASTSTALHFAHTPQVAP
ncbi:MAG TPA: TolC family protein, partial [Cellvibrionaceae bacterium]|nr:TolC family protein [Cellvibrionaceae bacterium]